MEPIISPWTIYLIHVIDLLKNVLTIILALGFVCMFPAVSLLIDKGVSSGKAFTIYLAVYVPLVIATALIPNKEVLLAMIISSELSPDKAVEQINLIMQAATTLAK